MLFANSGTGSHGEAPAGAIDLDGANDYFSRASDFTGNADGKTFTVSAWVWIDALGADEQIVSLANGFFTIGISNTGKAEIFAKKADGVTALNAQSTNAAFVAKTWNNVLISINLANTSNRSVYINDAAVAMTWTSYETTYDIDFTRTPHNIGYDATRGYLATRLAHVYLDKTYRDLSNSANRRLFITADRKPASSAALIALSPLAYFKMDDPATAHVNSGTGGNMSLNGTIARSGRGPNQFNAAYSDLDGSADYLSRTTSPTGIADGKAFTLAFTFNVDSLAATNYVMAFTDTGVVRVGVWLSTAGQINFDCRNASNTTILSAVTAGTACVVGRNYTVVASIDLASASNRSVTINGVAVSTTWTTYTNDSIDFAITATPRYHIGASGAATPSLYFNGRLGEVFFHTSYIDLSVAANLAKFVTGTGIDAKPADLGANGELPLATSPLIYLPMYGNDAGRNPGIGGAFTVNSGPYTGARGPNEFWGNKIAVTAAAGHYLSRASLTGAADSATWSFVGWFRKPDTSSAYLISFPAATAGYQFLTISDDNGQIKIRCCNATEDGWFLGWTSTSTTVTAANTDYCIQVARSGTTLQVYVNGASIAGSFDTQTATATKLASKSCFIGKASATAAASSVMNYAEYYFTTEYIDFSQEANRLKFRDAFGNPVSLGADGKTPTGTAPLIYMRFPPDSKGTNAGTAGAFSVNGTISDGGQL